MTEPLASRAGKVSYEGGSATLTFERHIGHPIEDVWDAITGSEPLQRWYMSKAIIEGRKDGRIELWSGSAQVHVTGRILTWDPPRVFEHERNMEPRKGIPTGERSIIRWELPHSARSTDGRSDRARDPCAPGQARERARPRPAHGSSPQDCRGPEPLPSAHRVTRGPEIFRPGIEPPAWTLPGPVMGPPTPRRSLRPGLLRRRGSRDRSTAAPPSAPAAASHGARSS